MSKLGYQIPNFTYPDTSDDGIVPLVVAQAKEADAAGFDRLTVMDHFYQLPAIGAPSEPMIECYTLLSALAQHTEHARLSALVTGNTYRNPALLAKQVTALDLLSGGRATLGIGAGWYEEEHTAYGYEFGTFSDRFEKLEESLQIVLPMLRGETATLAGKHYQVAGAVNSPAPISTIPIMIGGSGEKKTLRMVAQYADESNLVGLRSPDEIAPKLDALAQHCDALGRDRSEVAVTMLVPVCIAPTMEQADAELDAMIAAKGMDPSVADLVKAMIVQGDPDTVGEGLRAFMDAGLDGLTLSLMFNGHVPERVSLLGQVGQSVVR